MSNTELYKRYRPTRWDEIIGQDRVVSSLKAAVRTHKWPTGYWFFGERGTGKTTSALILAKAINCENPPGDGNPCNACDTCLSIDEGSQIGVTYVSGANEGGVDNIRDLTDKAMRRQAIPTPVFIIDEAHNLSPSAFDAMLIPVENPHMQSLFILCSTERIRSKTIQSRFQGRTFRLVPPDVMTPYLHDVCRRENLDLNEAIIDTAVRLGHGSVRDTLTCLDSAIATGDVSAMTTPYDVRMIDAVAHRDVGGVVSLVREASEDGMDGQLLLEQVSADLCDVLMFDVGKPEPLLQMMDRGHADDVVRLMYGRQGVMMAVRKIGSALHTVASGADPDVFAQITFLDIVAALSHKDKAQ